MDKTYYACIHGVSERKIGNHWECVKIQHPDDAILETNELTQVVGVPKVLPTILHKPYVWYSLNSSCWIKK